MGSMLIGNNDFLDLGRSVDVLHQIDDARAYFPVLTVQADLRDVG